VWLGVTDRLGSIVAGKDATILVIKGNPLLDIARMESTLVVIQDGRLIAR
jgi:imidazolonepropionase-like amidohydrolase